jgi:hypothetical protein
VAARAARAEVSLHGDGRAQRVGCASEHTKNPSPAVLISRPSLLSDGAPDDPAMFVEDIRVVIAETLEQPRRSFDVADRWHEYHRMVS